MERKRKLRYCWMAFWTLAVLSVFAAMIFILSGTGIFSNADNHLQHELERLLEHKTEVLQEELDRMTRQGMILAGETSRILEEFLKQENLSFEQLEQDSDKMSQLQEKLYPLFSDSLKKSLCSGVYEVMDLSEQSQQDNLRAGIYLRRENVLDDDPETSQIGCFRGISEAARKNNVSIREDWKQEFRVDQMPAYQQIVGQKINHPAQYYYWTKTLLTENPKEKVLMLCVPIVGEKDRIYGVCGAEVNSKSFQSAFPPEKTKFGYVTTVLAPLEDGKLMLKKGLTGGAGAQNLRSSNSLAVHHGKDFNTYIGKQTEFVGMQKVVNLSAYQSKQRQWAAALLLSEQDYQTYSVLNRRNFMVRYLAVFLVLLGSALEVYKKLIDPQSRKKADSVRKKFSPEEDKKILIEFVQKNPQSDLVEMENLPPELVEVFNRFIVRADNLNQQEKEIFRVLVKGCPTKEICSRTGLKARTVSRSLKMLCEELEVSDVEDILLYLDLFKKCGQQEILEKI